MSPRPVLDPEAETLLAELVDFHERRVRRDVQDDARELELVGRLRARGVSLRRIAAALGMPVSTAHYVFSVRVASVENKFGPRAEGKSAGALATRGGTREQQYAQS